MTEVKKGVKKKGPGRPRRPMPAERVHITLGLDIMDKLRTDVAQHGGKFSHKVEAILVAHYIRQAGKTQKEII